MIAKKKYIWLMACLVALSPLSTNAAKKQNKVKKAKTELWPDGTKMDAWFSNQKVNVDTLGKKYVITTGRSFGFAAPGTASAPTRIHSALAWYKSQHHGSRQEQRAQDHWRC